MHQAQRTEATVAPAHALPATSAASGPAGIGGVGALPASHSWPSAAAGELGPLSAGAPGGEASPAGWGFCQRQAPRGSHRLPQAQVPTQRASAALDGSSAAAAGAAVTGAAQAIMGSAPCPAVLRLRSTVCVTRARKAGQCVAVPGGQQQGQLLLKALHSACKQRTAPPCMACPQRIREATHAKTL